MSMSSPKMNMRPYMGDESGTHDVPELSRLMGSVMFTEECIDILRSPAAPESDEGGCAGIAIPFASCVTCSEFDVRCSPFFLVFQRHKRHPAFWTSARMIEDNLRMHQTGIFLRW